ncbi:UDP-glucose 4-epimerase GalE [Microbacterium sp. NPDC077644]|uniref:UDP-glucose 4-epimerase GalE n=1 Tax=Microbacterium sp. NPDC077644 TaxID=3155055 RepID=UPI00344F8CD8
MRVLLTGGLGYIGSHTAIALSAAGHHVLIVDDLSNSHREVIDRIEALSGCTMPLLVADVRDEVALLGFLHDHGEVDVAIHFAGLKAVAESVANPERYYDVNIGTTLALLRAMEAHGIADLVFSSSATVYGSSKSVPHTEASSVGTGIANPYGKTKHMIEEILRDACAANPDLRTTALRYFNPVGAHPSGMIGENPRGFPNNLMPIVAGVATGERDEVTVFGHDYSTPDGSGVRDYIHVQDLARGHVLAAEYKSKGFEAINLGSGVPSSVLDLIRAYQEVSGRNIPYSLASRRPGDVAVSYADVVKAERVLGWKAEHTLLEACRDDWAWQQATARKPLP